MEFYMEPAWLPRGFDALPIVSCRAWKRVNGEQGQVLLNVKDQLCPSLHPPSGLLNPREIKRYERRGRFQGPGCRHGD